MNQRPGNDEEGFTLIELMVVVLIIAILLAIAIPTFLGARKRAQDRAAQSSLRNSLTAAKTVYTDTQTYSGATDTALDAAEPTTNHIEPDEESTGPKMVSVRAETNVWYGAAESASGSCFAVKDSVSAGLAYEKITAGDCKGDEAAAAAASYTGW